MCQWWLYTKSSELFQLYEVLTKFGFNILLPHRLLLVQGLQIQPLVHAFLSLFRCKVIEHLEDNDLTAVNNEEPEESVEAVISDSNRIVVRNFPIRMDSMLKAVQFPNHLTKVNSKLMIQNSNSDNGF